MTSHFQTLAEDSLEVSRESIPRKIFNIILSAISKGEFLPGDRLREAVLAERLNVSQASIREALHLLSHCGLVMRDPNRGTYVTKFTREEVIERLKLRAVLECYAIREAKRNANPKSLKALKAKLEMLENASAIKDQIEFSQRDVEFHRTIWQMSGNKTLAATLEYVCTPLFAFVMIKMLPYAERLFAHTNPHSSIVDALERGTAKEAEAQMSQHINASWRPFLDDMTS